MKKLFLSLFISLSLLSLLSCEDDDSTINNALNPLIGKWNLTKIGHLETIGEENFVMYEDNVNECGINNVIFTDNTFELESFYIDVANCATSNIEGAYNYNTNNIILTFNEEVNGETVEMNQSLTVIKLTDDVLEIAFTNQDTGETEFNILTKD